MARPFAKQQVNSTSSHERPYTVLIDAAFSGAAVGYTLPIAV